jgi:hypothetical protein
MLYLRLIIFFSRGDVVVNNETLLVTDFINLKMRSTQFFRDAHKDMVYVCS